MGAPNTNFPLFKRETESQRAFSAPFVKTANNLLTSKDCFSGRLGGSAC